MSLSTLRGGSQFAFWAVALLVAALVWFLLSYYVLRADPPAVGGVAALLSVAGAVFGLVGCFPGNRYRWVSLLALVVNATVTACLAPWILWGL